MTKLISKNLILISVLVLLTVFLFTRLVWGWTNPTANPPSGGGALYYSGGNVGIGATSPGSRLTLGQSGDSTTGGLRTYNTAGTQWTAVYTGADNASYFQNANGYIALNNAGNVSLSGNLTVNGSASNTCTKVAYSYPATTNCPQYYYVTTIANPTQTGDMICCKVDNPS